MNDPLVCLRYSVLPGAAGVYAGGGEGCSTTPQLAKGRSGVLPHRSGCGKTAIYVMGWPYGRFLMVCLVSTRWARVACTLV